MNVKYFLSHKKCSCPPSISDLGKLKKQNRCTCCTLKSSKMFQTTVLETNVSCVIINKTALVHKLQPQSRWNFLQYCNQIIWTYFFLRIKTDRIDLAFDCYLNRSLKNDTRQLKGPGPRVNVKFSVAIISAFSKFHFHIKKQRRYLQFFIRKPRQD